MVNSLYWRGLEYIMRIAQIGNTAGVGSAISKEQHKKGLETNVFVFSEITQNRFGGIRVNYNSILEKTLFYTRLRFYDIWHYHSPFGTLYSYLKKNFKKKIFLKHYHGSDIRNAGIVDNDFCLVSTPDLLKFTPNGKWLPNPIDLDLIKKYRKTSIENSSPTKLAHYPYYRNKPEWNYIYVMINDFKRQHGIEVVEVFNMANEKCLEKIMECDIVLGKIITELGWFGKFELEAMALGKPVIAYVSDELYDVYKPPIFRTTKETFSADLQYLMNDKTMQKKLSHEGKSYVEKLHDSRIVADRVMKYYDQLKNNDI